MILDDLLEKLDVLSPAGGPRRDRARERTELWAMTFRALYGPTRGDAPGLSPGELPSIDPGARLTRRQLVARPPMLRRLLAPIVVAGLARMYQDDSDFSELLISSMRDLPRPPETFEVARARLVELANERVELKTGVPVNRAVQTIERLLSPERLLLVEPGYIVQQDGVATVSKRARFRAPFDEVRKRLDPKSWLEMGPFFEHVQAVPGEYRDRADGWDGLFEEKFVSAWSDFPFHTFHTFLTVDYTFDDQRTRADYALVYEADDQLERDDGFIEVRRVDGDADWCTYYAQKALRFRSPQSNLLSPMIMSVFLESGLSAIEDLALAARSSFRLMQQQQQGALA